MILEVALLDIGDVRVVAVFVHGPATAVDYEKLERASAAAGYEGDVVAVWPDHHGRTHFFARPERHAFFQTVAYGQLRAQINAQLELA